MVSCVDGVAMSGLPFVRRGSARARRPYLEVFLAGLVKQCRRHERGLTDLAVVAVVTSVLNLL